MDRKSFVQGMILGVALTLMAMGAVLDRQASVAEQRAEMQRNYAEFQLGQQAKELQACQDQAKFTTMIYEPAAAVTIPVLHGLAGISIAPGTAERPAYVIVAGQVPPKVFGSVPGAQYRWIDAKGHETGRFPVEVPQ